ncbi:MAG: hypothetical protein HY050_09200 [Actinobacteria bacterium]|nr:hypothetical protein [Actinomycetota bacterium]
MSSLIKEGRGTAWLGVAVMWFVGGSIYPFLSDATKTIAPINIVFLRTFGTTILLGSILLIFEPFALKGFRMDR